MNISESIKKKINKSILVKYKFTDLFENIVEKVSPKKSGLENYIGLKHLDTKSLKIRRFGKTSEVEGDKQKIYKGDFIFAKRNSYLKRVGIADFDAVASAHSLILRPKSENAVKDFLPFFLLSELFWQRAIEISVGSLSPTINWKTLAKQEFLLPPKKIQAELTQLLWSSNEVIEKQNLILDNLKRYDSSQLNFFFSDLQTSNAVNLKDIINLKKGKKPPSLKDHGDGLPYNTLNYLRFGKLEYIVPQKYISDLEKINQNDLLMVWDGNAAGEIIFGKDGILASTMCKLEIKNKNYLKNYIFQFIRSKEFYLRRTTIGSAIPHVYPLVFNKIKIPKLEINEQEKIVNIFEIIKKCIEDCEIQILKSKNLQKSLIKKIFNDV